jgi:hypothetical protein
MKIFALTPAELRALLYAVRSFTDYDDVLRGLPPGLRRSLLNAERVLRVRLASRSSEKR